MAFGSGARVDKAATLKGLTESKCEVKSYSFSDEQMDMIGPDVAALSFKAKQDYTCDGKKGPAEVWAASVYVREGDKWKSLYYSETPVTSPTDPTPKAAAAAAPSTEKGDALTEALMATETAAWDAWKNRDAKAIEAVLAKNFTYVAGSGRYDRAGSVKTWAEPKCEGLAYTFAEPKSVSLTSDVALVTYKADVKGKCDGKAVTPTVWVGSFSIKEGGVWKNAFYTDVNR
jgi:hypothetical protein